MTQNNFIKHNKGYGGILTFNLGHFAVSVQQKGGQHDRQVRNSSEQRSFRRIFRQSLRSKGPWTLSKSLCRLLRTRNLFSSWNS